jgi:hypothetical protein
MNQVRLWVVLLCLTCFAAGLSAGTIAAGTGPAVQAPSGPFDAYRTALVARFRLDPERERLFGELLRNYAQAIEAAEERLLQRSRPELERELAEIGALYQGYIRDFVVPPERRAEFVALSGQWQTIE